MMDYRLKMACGCHRGYRRLNNEDNFYCADMILPQENDGLDSILTNNTEMMSDQRRLVSVGVFDGMGGEANGQEAAYCAASAYRKQMIRMSSEHILAVDFLTSSMECMNRSVFLRANTYKCRMGTTAVLLLFDNNIVYSCNVGDSRSYALRENRLTQMSKDHTDAEILEKYKNIKRTPSLTQYIGMDPEEMRIEPYLVGAELKYGDQFLLCSDGLTDMVPEMEIKEIMYSSSSPEMCVNRLLNAALKNGGRDNVTVIDVWVDRL